MKKFISLVLVIAALAVIFKMGKDAVYRYFPLKYGGYIEQYAEEYDLDKFLVAGVICTESGFDNTAHSGRARGLMQMTDATADWVAERLGIDYDYDMAETPEINIRMGCYYLAYLIDKYKNTDTALAAYNAGMGKVTEWLADENYSKNGRTLYDIPYKETKNYVKRVKILTGVYKGLYGRSDKEWK